MGQVWVLGSSVYIPVTFLTAFWWIHIMYILRIVPKLPVQRCQYKQIDKLCKHKILNIVQLYLQ